MVSEFWVWYFLVYSILFSNLMCISCVSVLVCRSSLTFPVSFYTLVLLLFGGLKCLPLPLSRPGSDPCQPKLNYFTEPALSSYYAVGSIFLVLLKHSGYKKKESLKCVWPALWGRTTSTAGLFKDVMSADLRFFRSLRALSRLNIYSWHTMSH